jgi:hypothetical protein
MYTSLRSSGNYEFGSNAIDASEAYSGEHTVLIILIASGIHEEHGLDYHVRTTESHCTVHYHF